MLPSRWENVNRCSIKLIYFCNKLRLASDCKQSKYSQQIYNSYTYFSILSVAFAVSFLCYFQKLQLFDVKKIWTNFCCILLLYLWAQKVSQIFKTLFQTGYTNIFVLRNVFFSRHVQLKCSFLTKKHQRWNLRHNAQNRKVRVSFEKNIEKNTCAIMVRIIATFAN